MAEGKVAIHGAGILNVKVHTTTYHGENNPYHAPDHYLILDICQRTYELHRVILDMRQRTDEPQRVKVEWNEVLTLFVEKFLEQDLKIHVIKVESVDKHRYLGNATMELRDLTPEIPETCKLYVRRCRIDNYCIGDLKVELLYKPLEYHDHIPTISRSVQRAPIGMPNDGGLLVIIIHDVSTMGRWHQNMSVTMSLGSKSINTPSMMDTWKPIWIQEFTFMLEQPPTNEKLHVEVTNIKNDSWMGRLIFGKVRNFP
ncbi:putative C2 domain-containing protein [Helianthus anomalus]